MERLKNMLIGKRLVVVLGVLLTVVAAPAAIVLMNQYMDASADELPIEQKLASKVANLVLIGEYISYIDKNENQVEGIRPIADVYRTQVLDMNGARNAGIPSDIVILASKIVSYQNEMVSRSHKYHTTGTVQDKVSVDDYPKVVEFFNLATKVKQNRSKVQSSRSGSIRLGPIVIGGISKVFADDEHPCGNYDYPVPDYSPARHYFDGDGETFFDNAGYHETARYAGGNYEGTDYTKGRSYNGDYGTCSSPRFRDHGLVHSSDRYSIQYGEPNPEVLSYLWPYWNWGSYVEWWHENY